MVNSGTCYRPPEAVVARWRDEHGNALAGDGYEARLADVEGAIGVGPVPAEVMGRNGELALAGAAALGWRSGPLQRNAPGCRGACQCAIGCPNNAKAGVHLNALPEACAAGARIVTGLRVDRVMHERGRATGVRARRPDGSAVDLRAPRVIVACGAVETPPLLRRSRLGGHPRLGRGLSIHPALGVAGSFAEPVFAWRGVLQSAGIEELPRAQPRDPDRGDLDAAGDGRDRLPGGGRGAGHRARRGGAHSVPRGDDRRRPVGPGARQPPPGGRLPALDRRRGAPAPGARRGCRAFCSRPVPSRSSSAADSPRRPRQDRLDQLVAGADVRRLRLAAFHPTGTAGAGADPARHPVGPTGALRGVDGVWVADGSILPSCPGVNPQVSIMAMAGAAGAAVATA